MGTGAPIECARDTRKNFSQGEMKFRQHVAAVECIVFSEQLGYIRRGIDTNTALPSIHQPDLPDAAEKVFAYLEIHLTFRVPRAENFHGQVGGKPEDRLVRNLTPGQSIPGNERHIWTTDEPFHELYYPVRTRKIAQVVMTKKIL